MIGKGFRLAAWSCFSGLIVVAMAACHDSSEQVAGIDGSGSRVYAQGAITAFGSIVVNGTHYDVESAQIRVNGEVATESDLAIGQVVSVEATIAAGGNSVADMVNFEALLRGPVQAVDLATATVMILDQEVRVGIDTVLDLGAGAGIDALDAGDMVEVSGLFTAESRIEATLIARAPASATLRIVGEVDDLELGTLEFSIGDLVVDYSSATLIEGFPGGAPSDDDRVLVVGDALNAEGDLVATRLVFVDDDGSERAGQEAEVEGLITRFVSATDFDVSGRRATTTARTIYEGGSESDLVLNGKIQIEGGFDSQGVIVADKIEVKDGS